MAQLRKVERNGNRRQRSHSPAERPPLLHFLKIIIPGTMDEKKLSIPLEFVRKYGDDLGDVAKLLVPDGKAWEVGITKSKNSIWFDDGWHEFVEHHSIGYGYSVVFAYNGSSNFNVIIFDMTACEIQYSCSGLTRGEGWLNYGKKRRILHEEMEDGSTIPPPLSCSPKHAVLDGWANEGESSRRHDSAEQNPKESPNIKNSYDTRKKAHIMKGKMEIKDDDSNESSRGKAKKQGTPSSDQHLVNEIMDCNASKTNFANPSSSGEKESPPKCEEDIETFEMFTTGLKNASQESERAIHAARMFKPKNPSFMAVLRPHNFYNRLMIVPTEFARGYLHEVSNYIKLQVSDGREWLVRAICQKYGGLTLGKGWNEFTKENKLEVGDICVFELIKNNFVLKVSIFRAHEDVVS